MVAEHELKPTLNLVLEGYSRGLNGDFDAARSFGDQFTGTPSYNAGLAYQRPRRNIAAQAIARERRMEVRRALLELEDTLLHVGAEVESAAAAVQASYRLLESAIHAAIANRAEVEYLQSLWNDSFVRGLGMNSLQLDQLLNAQIQLIAAENQWVSAERDLMIALARLELSTGSLLPAEDSPLPP
jgi:outer membrane protein TolC